MAGDGMMSWGEWSMHYAERHVIMPQLSVVKPATASDAKKDEENESETSSTDTVFSWSPNQRCFLPQYLKKNVGWPCTAAIQSLQGLHS